MSFSIAVVFALTANAWAQEEVFTDLNEAHSITQGTTAVPPPYNLVATEPEKINKQTWFQTSNQVDTRENIQLTVNLKELPEPESILTDRVQVIGGFSQSTADQDPVANNTVHVVYQGDPQKNLVSASNSNIAAGKAFQHVIGGLSRVAPVHDNQVFFKGTANAVYGGWSIYGDTSHNSVRIEDSAVQHVTGGYGQSGANNTVEIVNSNVFYVYGANMPLFHLTGASTDQVTGNHVILRGKVESNTIAGAYGSYGGNGTTYMPFDQGNTITINGTVRTKALIGFDTLQVQLTKQNQETAALRYLKVTKETSIKRRTLENRQIHISFDPGLNCCGSYKIMDMDADDPNKVPVGGASVNVQDALIHRTWKFHAGETVDHLSLEQGLLNGLAAQSTEKTSGTKILGESLLASLALVNQGAEFIADEGLNAMTAAAQLQGPVTFGAVHGGNNRYETGSPVDLKGGALAAGVANRYQALAYAGFIESGWASSASHVEGTAADGDHNYYGVGAALRFAAAEAFHVDAAARLGWAKTKFSGAIADSPANYDSTALYFTGHVGAGYVVPLSQTVSAEAYARYVYSILNGDKTTVKNYDYETKAAHTHATRVGLRLRGTVQETVSWRVGAAWEHVFGGDAKSQINCGTAVALDAPSLAGDTGIVEVGTTLKPSAESPWSFDLGVKGYAGDRRGVTGNAAVLYRF